MCGYEIMSTIKKSHGFYIGASTIYPTLNALESKKLVKGEWNMQICRPKKIYRITENGYATMQYSLNSINQIFRTSENENKDNNTYDPLKRKTPILVSTTPEEIKPHI
jgi:DNA-binding PadR family transcriptional regulator